jgi:hypothetical protein
VTNCGELGCASRWDDDEERDDAGRCSGLETEPDPTWRERLVERVRGLRRGASLGYRRLVRRHLPPRLTYRLVGGIALSDAESSIPSVMSTAFVDEILGMGSVVRIPTLDDARTLAVEGPKTAGEHA